MKLLKLPTLNQRQDGFSLLEMLIYVAIFATIIGAVVGLAGLASAQKATSQITADINYQGEAAMALITQTVHQASAITTPAAGGSNSQLSLAMGTASVNPSVFSSYNDGTTNRLRISEGTGTVIQTNLTNGKASISNLTFTNMSLSGTKGSVLINFTLTYKTTSARQELTYSKQFTGAATIP